LILDHVAHHHSRLNPNYITDYVTKDSNNQGSNQKSNNEIESHEDCMKISEEEASESGNPQLRGQF
jgi:hypothetical protein